MSNYVIWEGTVVRFLTTKPFSTFTGTAVDPDVVKFSYSVQHAEPVTFTYTNGSGDPTGTIVRDGVGLYHADIDTTNLEGVWSYQWSGAPSTSVGHDTTKTQVVVEGSPLIISATGVR